MDLLLLLAVLAIHFLYDSLGVLILPGPLFRLFRNIHFNIVFSDLTKSYNFSAASSTFSFHFMWIPPILVVNLTLS